MIKIFRELKSRAGWILLIFALLFLQAFCDLALPAYTSRIVDTGIQQKGVEDAVPDAIRAETLDSLLRLMDGEEGSKVQAAYSREEGDLYILDSIRGDTREELNGILGRAMVLEAGLESRGVSAAALTEEQLEALRPEAEKQLEGMSESILTQAAVTYVQQEYTAQGRNLDSMQTRYVLFSGLSMLGLSGLSMLAAILVTFFSSRVAAGFGHDLRNRIYRKVLSFSSSEMNRFSTASLITRSTNDIQQIQMVLTLLFRIVLYAPILGIGGVLKVLNTGSEMTWILGVGVAAIFAVMIFLFTVAMPKFRILQTLIDRVNLVTREILTGIPVIRAFSAEKHEEERFDEANRELTRTNLFVNRCMTFMMPVMMLIMNGLSVLIVYSGSHAIDAGRMQVGGMMAFIQYAMQIIMAFLMISMVAVFMPRASVSARRIYDVLETETEIKNPVRAKKPAAGLRGELEFRNVSFCYPGAEEKVLDGISFRAGQGETVAFIGSTGSGKSTLVNLIPRFFDVTEGQILVDGVDIRDMNLEDLRSRLGYVPQKAVLFSGTIASNLRYGDENASSGALRQAAEIAQAAAFIDEKPEGMETPIAQGGANVSGGQKQRLAIARAVAKKPEIYIFDDSFSALDFQTDAALRRALKRETGDATSLIVAQRISTILHADRILVLDGGKLAGCGTHEELMKNCEVYRQIARSQLSEEELGA